MASARLYPSGRAAVRLCDKCHIQADTQTQRANSPIARGATVKDAKSDAPAQGPA